MWILKVGDLFGGRYRILRELGTGGMSYVFAALDEELNEKVALKIIKPEFMDDDEFVARFKREVRIARQIRHPNIIQVFEFGGADAEGKRLYYLTMELLKGRDLGGVLRKQKELPMVDILRISLQTCDALAEAHRAGVVHRDIKPQNIFIDEEGQVKLMDFGISRLGTLPSVTTGGQLIGTPKYMAPEQVHRKSDPDHRSDIYALGIVLYELCTKRTPFQGDSTVEVALKQVQEVPEPPISLNAEIPSELNQIIMTCLEKDPENRFQSVVDLRAQLQSVPSHARRRPEDDSVTEIINMQPTEKSTTIPPTAVATGVASKPKSMPASTLTPPPQALDEKTVTRPREIHRPAPRHPVTERRKGADGSRLKMLLFGAAGFLLVSFLLFLVTGGGGGEGDVDGNADAVADTGGATSSGGATETPELIVEPDMDTEGATSEDGAGSGSGSTAGSNDTSASGATDDAASTDRGGDSLDPSSSSTTPTSSVPAAPTVGRLEIRTNPAGARLQIDGRQVGTTPWEGTVQPGLRRLTLSANNHVTAQESIRIEAGETSRRNIRLSAIARNTTARFSANPGTEVYLDGELLGEVPPVIEKELSVGSHRLRYVMPGYAEHEETIELRTGPTQEFTHQFPVPGALRVTAQPYARVFLDGKDLGFTPVSLSKVSEGQHQLVLERERFRRIEQTINIRPFEINRFQFALEREP